VDQNWGRRIVEDSKRTKKGLVALCAVKDQAFAVPIASQLTAD